MLELDRVEAFYGWGQVLWALSLNVSQGEVVALLGRNGAGKTTLLKAIMGLVERRGRITFDGNDLMKIPPYRIPRLGIAYLPQGERLFPDLTLRENLALVAHDGLEEVLEYFPELKGKLEQRAGTLSGGEQQLAALARALLAQSKLLLLDEPSEGLAPQLLPRVEGLLRSAHRQGMSILLVEQRVDLALRLAKRVYILERGRIAWAGRAEELGKEELKRHLGI
jgi:branched-chain amino acid transport system ATP-binding protein